MPPSAEKAVTAELIKSAVAEALQAQSVPLEAATRRDANFDPTPRSSRPPSPRLTPRTEGTPLKQQDLHHQAR